MVTEAPDASERGRRTMSLRTPVVRGANGANSQTLKLPACGKVLTLLLVRLIDRKLKSLLDSEQCLGKRKLNLIDKLTCNCRCNLDGRNEFVLGRVVDRCTIGADH
jgi:hypothetical protein